MHIVMVAGEASGDILGAGLMQAMLKLDPSIRFSGIGGERMQALGFESLFALDRLSVMGFVEPLKRLPELLHIRRTLKQHCLDTQADAFIGIDSPDFNLNIERFAKQHGIKAVHYVSPSVWAWRQGRIKGIKASVDLMLTLLPFEAEFYRQHNLRWLLWATLWQMTSLCKPIRLLPELHLI
jgi:lipid-A-disaccharide synthase